MPIFEYVCDACGEKFEKLVLRQDTDPLQCPACGADRVTQQLSTFLSPVAGKNKPSPRPSPEHDTYSHPHDD